MFVKMGKQINIKKLLNVINIMTSVLFFARNRKSMKFYYLYNIFRSIANWEETN